MIAGRESHGFPKKMAERIRLESDGPRIVGSVTRKGIEILRIELEPTGPASLADLALINRPSTDASGRTTLPLPSYLFKFFPSTTGRGFDYLPRLIRQVTVFRPRADLRRGRAVVAVDSSETDPLGDIPVLGAPLVAVHGHFDNTMLPGKVVARVWNPWRFVKHAMFKSDVGVALLGRPAQPIGHAAELPAH